MTMIVTAVEVKAHAVTFDAALAEAFDEQMLGPDGAIPHDTDTAAGDQWLYDTLHEWRENYPLFFDGCIMPGMLESGLQGEAVHRPQYWLCWVLVRMSVRYPSVEVASRFGGRSQAKLQELCDCMTESEVDEVGVLVAAAEHTEVLRSIDAKAVLSDNPLAGTW